jgi:hypothetical protein
MVDSPSVGPEVRRFARDVLEVLDPLLEAATSRIASTAEGGAPSECRQPWCPLCAGVALASGQAHPLVSMIAENGAALLALIHTLANADGSVHDGEDVGRAEHGPPRPARGGYEPIPVIMHE